jgi:hypothetical protein
MDYKENIVYRYVDISGNIIYVGKTGDLKRRFQEHKKEEMYKDCYKVEYIELDNPADIEIYETYYINKWMPKYNGAKKYCEPSFFIPEQNWKTYYINRKNDTRHSTEIKRYEEIFMDINELKFGGKLPLPRILLTKTSSDGKFICDEIIKTDNGFQLTFELNEEDCFGNTKNAVYSLFHNMVHMYNFLNGIKDTCNNGIYHNDGFGQAVISHGGFVEKYSYGYKISGLDQHIKDRIYRYNINYNCGEKYSNQKKKKQKSSSRTYIDKQTGESIRATKEHTLFCLDDKPEIVRRIIDTYGIEPMVEKNKIC